MNTKTQTIIQKLLSQADYYDKFGPTFDGQLMRDAAAALAEAHNQKVIGGMLVNILKGGR